MNGPTDFLLDTNAVICLLRGDARLTELLGVDHALSVSVITVLEFRSFANLSDNDIDLFRAFARFVRVIDLSLSDSPLIESAVELRRTRRLKLPDAVILATAKVYSLTLVTADQALARCAGDVKVIAL